MDCREIKELLEQYADNDLSKETAIAVKKHLALCRECGAEFVLLKKYKEEMSALKIVKAPADFLQQLNARIDNQSFFKRIITALFFPLKFKIPIEAAGLLTAAVLVAIFVNPLEQMRKDTRLAGNIALNEQTISKDEERTIADIAEISKKSDAGRVSLPVKTEDDRLFAKAERKPESSGESDVRTQEIILALYHVRRGEAPGAFKSMAARAPAAQSEEAADINAMDAKKAKSAGAAAENSGADQLASENFAKVEKKTRAVQAEKARVYDSEEVQGESITRKTTVSQSIRDIREIVTELKGKIVKEDTDSDGIVKYIVAEIAVQNQNEFLNKLGKLGIVRSKEGKSTDADKFHMIRYKINITQP